MKKITIKKLLRMFWVFPVNNKKICFICNRGNQFCCNPKYMADYITQKHSNHFEIIWVYENELIKKQAQDLGYRTVKLNSGRYVHALTTSKYIISNITIPEWIPYRDGQVKVCTWHGSAFKGYKNEEKYNYNLFDYFIAENELTENAIRNKDNHNFQNTVLRTGMPRNDVLIKENFGQQEKIKKQIGVPVGKKVLLYAPTFRDRGTARCYSMDFEKLQKALRVKFGGEWVIAFRYHPLQKDRKYMKDCIKCSDYHDMQELLKIADVLITDYSSCMWDFSLMKKICFIYSPDIDDYVNHDRGDFVYPINQLPFPLARKFDELLKNISCFSNEVYMASLDRFHREWGRYNYDGNATSKVVEFLLGKAK